ncbi:hypothetical protein M3J09_011037 [Ascochyta lentis]
MYAHSQILKLTSTSTSTSTHPVSHPPPTTSQTTKPRSPHLGHCIGQK